MRFRQLGDCGPEVSEIGFGGWALGGGWGDQDDQTSIATLQEAIRRGVNFIDTAEGYGDGHGERIIAKALRDTSLDGQSIVVATKTPPAAGPWPPSPYCRWQDRYSAPYLRKNVEQRLRTLNVERLDVLQLHSWTRAWNDDPQPLLVLRQLRDEGKIGMIGVSTPEQDQNCVVQLMRDGLVDVVQVIFNLFDQEAAAQIFPVAQETGTGVIVRVALDEGALTGKFANDHVFSTSDFRRDYFAGDRLSRTIDRVKAIQDDVEAFGLASADSLTEVALKFVLAQPAVSTVIVGMRTVGQAKANTAVSDQADLPTDLVRHLRRHNWRRGIWYGGR